MKNLRIKRNHARVLVVDVQERLLPSIHDADRVVEKSVLMLRAAQVLGVPALISEQYRKGLGATAPAILAAAGNAPRLEKMAFSCAGDDGMLAALNADERDQVLLVGIETHVCVQQTAIDLFAYGMQPVIIADAVGSRRALDREIALERMRHIGVTITTAEAAIFEMLEQAGTEEFRAILPLVR